ncbi:MAG: hydrogenase maturation protease [Anaerolineaceae bacterium]
MSQKTLIIAYGNRDRQDDGAGWHILAKIAHKLGLTPPEFPGEWVETSDGNTRLLYLYQLLPEMAEDLMPYHQVIFVDAHNSPALPDLTFQPIEASWEHSAFTHHMSAEEVLSITETLYGVHPQAKMLTVRGYLFEFERELSDQTAALVEQAAALLESELAQAMPPTGKPKKP